MAWVYLLTAAVFEIGWPLGFKMSHLSEYKISWIVFSVLAMALSGIFLYLAQKSITISVAYAVWTGIGAMGTFLLGVLVFGDNSTLYSWLGVILIITGVAFLKISHLSA